MMLNSYLTTLRPSVWQRSLFALAGTRVHARRLKCSHYRQLPRGLALGGISLYIECQYNLPYLAGAIRLQNAFTRTGYLRHILGKTRFMMVACNAPGSLRDEFLNTAAYLTTLTASTNLGGKTPYELWNGRAPSLSHLREMSCPALALTATQNPKAYQCSEPYILVGYQPRTKEYRLWNPSSGKMFRSLYVIFIEHLDTVPANLEPGTTVSIVSTAALPSWDAPVCAVTAARQPAEEV